MLTQAPINLEANPEGVMHIKIEDSHEPAMYISMQAALTLYSSDRNTGTGMDRGIAFDLDS